MIIALTIGIISASVLSVLVDWLVKLLLPKRPKTKHIIVGGTAILALVFMTVWAQFQGLGKDLSPLISPTQTTDPQNMESIFPFFIGSTWTYNFSKLNEAPTNGGKKLNQTIGRYTETVVGVESALSDKVKIISLKVSGENFLNNCKGGGMELTSGEVLTWRVVDSTRMFQTCSMENADTIATQIIHQFPMDKLTLPDFVSPFEVGKVWAAFPDVPPREDKAYQWFVESKVDITVPSGAFVGCYRIMLFTLPDATILWVCPGVGLVAGEYQHHGAFVTYRTELSSYKLKP